MDAELEEPDEITLLHGDEAGSQWLAIETSVREQWDSPREIARRAAWALFDREPAWPEVSEAALTVWLRAGERERYRAMADGLREGTVVIDVDGAPTRFVQLKTRNGWAAVGRIDRATVTITARGLGDEDLHLRRVDPTTLA